MRSSPRNLAAFAATGLLAIGVAACGGSSGGTTSSGAKPGSSSSLPQIPLKAGENPVGQPLYGKKTGGTLTVYSSEDFIHFDPGEAYFALDYSIVYATQKTLFWYLPNTQNVISPNLATEVPTVANGGITDGGKTVTVHIRQGIYFSPPVNREVTSADVAYALERASNPNVANPYFAGYLGAASPTPLVGTTSSSYKGGPIPGIQTPSKFTIVFHMTKPGASFLIQALSMPVSAPVPESFAGPMDKQSPTTYGTKYLVASGPYMIKNDPKTGAFENIGYQTGKSLTLVRNPNWHGSADPATPAYLNNININIGGDATVIGEQTLKGTSAVQLDTPTQSVVKLAYESYPSQITFTPGSGMHYVTLNHQHGPFQNVNLRRAFYAALDRAGVVKVIGGSLVAYPGTHFLYPGVDGFQQAGGYAGPQVPWNTDVNGNLAVAQRYMKAAGYKSGKYTGSATVQVVGTSNGNDPAVTQLTNTALTELGFKTHVSLVDQSVMYSKYCGVPKQQIDVCPTGGWIRDFADPLTVLWVPFYGPNIVPTNNSNSGVVNDPTLNAAMKAASLVVDPTARAQAWANVDKLIVEQADAVPEDFDNQPDVESKNVAGVNDLWNEGTWSFSFTSLK